jgi:hypothetical protein
MKPKYLLAFMAEVLFLLAMATSEADVYVIALLSRRDPLCSTVIVAI